MATIQDYQQDQSASTRLAIWQWTFDYAVENPFGGGFEAYRQNRLRIELTGSQEAGSVERIEREVVADQGRAYHSAYFEMLGEQGFPGLALFLLLHAYGVIRMEALRRRYRAAGGEDAWISPLAGALQTAHLVYLTGALFIGIAFMPFMFMLMSAEIGLDNHLRRKAMLRQGEDRRVTLEAKPTLAPAS